jgi:hypothetical protein
MSVARGIVAAMADLRHEAVAQLFRDNDQLAPYLVVACGERVRTGIASRADSDLSLIDHGLDMPGPPHRERRADVVTVINEAGKVCQVIISEPQSTEPDLEKWFSWIVYIGVAGRTFSSLVTLLVVPLNDETARVCRLGFYAGPNLRLNLVVADRESIPHPDKADGENCALQVTMLNALTGGFDLAERDTRRYVLAKLAQAEPRLRTTYTRVLWFLAEPEVRKDMEEDMTLAELRVPFLDDPIDEGIAKGRTEGRTEGEVTMLLHIIKTRRISLSEADRDLVTSCADRTQLEYWAERALEARTADDIFRPR